MRIKKLAIILEMCVFWKNKENNQKKENTMISLKRIVSMTLAGIITAASLWGATGIEARADGYWPNNVNVESGAAIVVEMETGTVLYGKNVNKAFYPASITKIMTALLALENCDLDETVEFSETAVYENEGDTSHIAREVGEQMTLEACLYGMMLESANECAWAIGEHVGGGSMDEFVRMMNARAKELGCTNTHFVNPNGLPDNDHYVTAHDMALIARAAYQIPKFQEICGTRAYTIPADNKKEAYNCNNTHGMISNHRGSSYLYEYALGGKTGYTDEAGNTLVTFARKDGMTLLCVVLNSSNPAHYEDTERLFEYCFYNFSKIKVADNVSITELNETKATGMLSDKIDLIRIDPADTIILPKTANFSDAQPTVVPASKKDGTVAKIQYKYAGRKVGSADLVYEKAEKSSYPFHNLSKEEGGTALKYFRIDFKTILLVMFIIAMIMLAGYILHLQSGKILLYKHRHFKSKKNYRGKYTQINRKRKPNANVRKKSTNVTRNMNKNIRAGQPIKRSKRRNTLVSKRQKE